MWSCVLVHLTTFCRIGGGSIDVHNSTGSTNVNTIGDCCYCSRLVILSHCSKQVKDSAGADEAIAIRIVQLSKRSAPEVHGYPLLYY